MRPFDDSVILHPGLKSLFNYWHGLSVDGALPLRRRIDPLAIRRHLPNVHLIDAARTPDELRYRLAGSLIVQAFGFEPGRRTRSEIRARYVKPERHAEFDRTSAETHRVVSERIVAYTHDYMTSYTKDYLAYARINMPISEDGASVSGIFGAIYMSSDGNEFWQQFQELHVEFPLANILARMA